jgi:hypothetical protein
MTNPDAASSDEGMLNIKFYVHVLGCLSNDGIISNDEEKQANIHCCITAMYHCYVHARPDISSLKRSGSPKSNIEGAETMYVVRNVMRNVVRNLVRNNSSIK